MSAEKFLRVMFNKLSALNCAISKQQMENLKIHVDKRMKMSSHGFFSFTVKNPLTFDGNIVSHLFGGKYAEKTVKQSPNIYKNENLSLHDQLQILLQKEESLVQAGVSDF